jgi:DNA polymerase I-like protein with 3'-5' exonuclease and polymerase domains
MQDRELEALTRGYVETIVGRRRHFAVAPVMYRILNDKGIELEDFIKAQDKTLNYENLKAFPLDHDDMVRLSRESKIPYIIWKENGWWAFAKHKLKNDLNNAKNFPIQALAAHITNVAMIDISRDLRQHGIDGYVCLQVHDEITVYAKEVHAELAKQIVKKRMEDNWVTRLLDVPMKTEPLIANNLKEAK